MAIFDAHQVALCRAHGPADARHHRHIRPGDRLLRAVAPVPAHIGRPHEAQRQGRRLAGHLLAAAVPNRICFHCTNGTENLCLSQPTGGPVDLNCDIGGTCMGSPRKCVRGRFLWQGADGNDCKRLMPNGPGPRVTLRSVK